MKVRALLLCCLLFWFRSASVVVCTSRTTKLSHSTPLTLPNTHSPAVCSTLQGVMVGTERAIRAAAAEGLPICLLISKVDRCAPNTFFTLQTCLCRDTLVMQPRW